MIKPLSTFPCSQDSEMIVLGCALSSLEHLKVVTTNIKKEDFYFAAHQIIFESLLDLESSGTDVHLLCESLKRQNQLSQVGGAAYVIQLVQFAGTSAYIEEYVEELKRFSMLRKIAGHSKTIEDRALKGNEDPKLLLEEVRNFLGKQEEQSIKPLSILPIAERIKKEEAFLTAHKGKKYLGLQTQFIEEFNDCFLGLRGLNLLAAAPNSGKTALAIQLAIDAVMTNQDVCLVFVSLEMSSDEIFRRMVLLLAEMDYRTFVFGPWGEAHQEAIARAKKVLSTFHERIQILESSSCPSIDAKTITDYVSSLKVKTNCQRAIVVIDYLQVWPINASMKFLNENEIDKWRIGEMKRLKDFLSPDPVIVISEARKPSLKENTWGGDLADVMGSARATYTPDVVMLLTPVKGKQLQMLWEEHRMSSVGYLSQEEEGTKIKSFLEAQGIALCKLEVPKARDGMQKFSLLLEFHFQRNKFQKLDLERIRKTLNFSTLNKSKTLKKKGNNQSFLDLFLEV